VNGIRRSPIVLSVSTIRVLTRAAQESFVPLRDCPEKVGTFGSLRGDVTFVPLGQGGNDGLRIDCQIVRPDAKELKMTTTCDYAVERHAALLGAMSNLTHFHREHEKFYGAAPRETAVALQRHARTLQALADRWSSTASQTRSVFSPYEGAEDLNADAAVQLDGVLFLEGEGEPAEIARIKRELRALATDAEQIGRWLAEAMQSSWTMAATLLEIDGLADLLGERHRIIANDWQAANMNSLCANILKRAAAMLDTVDFTPQALRADLDDAHVSSARLFAAGELIDHAADLYCDSSALVHQNERRWRVFHARVDALLQSHEELDREGA
jgi:hypothetical protein